MPLHRPFVGSSRIAFSRAIVALAIWNLAVVRASAAQDSSVVPLPDSSRSSRRVLVESSGADVAVIFPDSLPDLPRTMSELLAARVPGLFVQRSTGAAGASSWISMRDAGAVQGFEPLVIVDGVRRVSTSLSYGLLDSEPIKLLGERLGPSPIDDISVDEIERVEILRGPAAAARYGRDARYGVILVTTRPPTAGRLRFRASVTGGFADEQARFPANFAHLTTGGSTCPNAAAAAGYCTQVGTSSYTVLRDRSPFSTGARREARLDASGGLGRVALALGASHGRAEGVLPMDGTDHTTVTARMFVPFTARVRLSLSAQTSLRGVTQPAQGSSTIEVISGGILGWPIDCSPSTPCATSTTSHGYWAGTPDFLATLGTRHRLQHFSEGAVLDVDATSWLSAQSSISFDGMGDRGTRVDEFPPTDLYGAVIGRDIVRHAVRSTFEELLRARWVVAALQATTTFAVRADRDRSHETTAAYTYDSNFRPDRIYMSWGISSTVDRRTTIRLEQRVNAGDLLSVSAGALWARTAVGLRPTLDGFADASVRLVDSSNAPRGLRSLRVRTAAGQVSGYDPRAMSRLGSISSPIYPFPQQPPDVPPVRPQRALELEAGIDAELAPARLHLSVTTYRRIDAEPYLVAGVAPQPSTGYAVVADMRRRLTGLEFSGGATLVNGERVRWTTQGHLALANDRVTHWTRPPLMMGGSVGAQRAMAEGKSFGSWRTRPSTWTDLNSNGMIDIGEVSYPGDFEPWPMGAHARPTTTAGFQNSITVMRALTVGAQLDYVGGHKVLNLADAAQCLAESCTAVNDAGAPLAEQARGVSAFTGQSVAGYLQSGATLRLRELSVSIGSARLASLAHASSLSVTIAARNLATWSRYHGLDPEIDLPSPGLLPDEPGQFSALYLPTTRQLTARLTLAY